MPSVRNNAIQATVESFFDRQKVARAVDRAERKNLSKGGAFVRRTGRTLLRKKARLGRASDLEGKRREYYEQRVAEAKERGEPPPPRPLKHSRPGEPPKQITGLLRRFLFFSFDRSTRSVPVGPAKLSGKDADTPRLLEEGGNARRRLSVPVRRRSGPRKGKLVLQRKSVNAKYEARPFMGPALDKNQSKLAQLWANSVV